MVYLISYDLHKPVQNYDELYTKLKGFSNYLHPLESTWLVNTNWSAKQIFQHLSPALDSDDKIFIAKLAAQWHALLTQRDYDWLHDFLAK